MHTVNSFNILILSGICTYEDIVSTSLSLSCRSIRGGYDSHLHVLNVRLSLIGFPVIFVGSKLDQVALSIGNKLVGSSSDSGSVDIISAKLLISLFTCYNALSVCKVVRKSHARIFEGKDHSMIILSRAVIDIDHVIMSVWKIFLNVVSYGK